MSRARSPGAGPCPALRAGPASGGSYAASSPRALKRAPAVGLDAFDASVGNGDQKARLTARFQFLAPRVLESWKQVEERIWEVPPLVAKDSQAGVP